jgi:hypothetical protein
MARAMTWSYLAAETRVGLTGQMTNTYGTPSSLISWTMSFAVWVMSPAASTSFSITGFRLSVRWDSEGSSGVDRSWRARYCSVPYALPGNPD